MLNELWLGELAEMVTRREQKERTSKHLIEVALMVFADKGFGATRTVDIARAASVAHGTVFTHFPTRDELLCAVIEAFAQRLIRRIAELAEGGAGVREVLRAHLDGLREHEQFYVRLISERSLLPPMARTTLIGIQSVISIHLSQAARADEARGRLRELEPHLLFNTWMGLLHYYLTQGDLFAPGESVIERRGQEILDHYVRLLTP